MTCSIKILKDIRNCFPIKPRVALLSALVLSHCQYPSLMLVGNRKNLMISLEKQHNWGLKMCFKRKKYNRSTAWKMKKRIMPDEFPLKYRYMVFVLKYAKKLLPILSIRMNCKLPSASRMREQEKFIRLWKVIPNFCINHWCCRAWNCTMKFHMKKKLLL